MSVSMFKLKKWFNMLRGKSVYHVKQDEGKYYSKDEIQGYYNNFTEKVTRFGLPDDTIPTVKVDSGEEVYFAGAIFQYGLGAYDLYLMNKDESMLKKTMACVNWALEKQQNDGGWAVFDFENKENPYSSMAQGEGVSLLLRAYKVTEDSKYVEAARAALEFMLKPKENGGTTLYDGDDVYFYEYTQEPLILNGWIFSIWGLMDYCKCTKDEKYEEILNKTLKTLIHKLPDYDIGYWSKYDEKDKICSSFYHHLHIAQLNVMYKLTGEPIFSEYAEKWTRYQSKWCNRTRAFIKKAYQKIVE